MKLLDDRIHECIQIKKQIDQLGIGVLPECKETLAKHMNAFIQEGISQTCILNIPDSKIQFKVILTVQKNKQSGIIQLMD